MKAATFYLEPIESLHRFVLSIVTFMVDLTFRKILNIRGESRKYITLGISHMQKVSFLQMHRSVSLKECREKLLEEPCNYPDF